MAERLPEIAGLKRLDREKVMERMAMELPAVRRSMGISADRMAQMLQMELSVYAQIEEHKRKLKWGDYLAILFLLWEDGNGRGLIEARGMFPDELKGAMGAHRDVHAQRE